MSETFELRQDKDKELILQYLRETSIVQVACLKTGVSRASYYRWHHDDPKFAKAAEEAIDYGEKYFCDMAESKLIKAIENDNLGAIIFYLKVHHPKYSLGGKNNITVSGGTETPKKILVSWERKGKETV